MRIVAEFRSNWVGSAFIKIESIPVEGGFIVSFENYGYDESTTAFKKAHRVFELIDAVEASAFSEGTATVPFAFGESKMITDQIKAEVASGCTVEELTEKYPGFEWKFIAG